MKKLRAIFCGILVLLIMGTVVAGCDNGDDDSTYTPQNGSEDCPENWGFPEIPF